jgi:DNA repair protein RadD
MRFSLRDYQRNCADAVESFLQSAASALAVLPTGAGKTIIFAALIERLFRRNPDAVVWVVAHRKELIQQAANKILEVWPGCPLGIMCAGLGRMDRSASVIVASIQSIRSSVGNLPRPTWIIIDEAHRIPLEDFGEYRRMIEYAKWENPHGPKVIGFTATPFRLDGGDIAARGNVFESVCFEAKITPLIKDGFLCQLTSKYTGIAPSLDGVPTIAGEFKLSTLEKRVIDEELISRSVEEIVKKGSDRKCWLVFCVSVAHAEAVSRAFGSRGIYSPVITGKTKQAERERLLADFSSGKIRCVCNVNVLTEGFDNPRVDLIAILRPTKSAGLYVQMVGRGFRVHPDKQNCLILDMGGNIERHGPVDCVRPETRASRVGGISVVKVCPNCNEYLPAAVGKCNCCGQVFRVEKHPHSDRPSQLPVLSTQDRWVNLRVAARVLRVSQDRILDLVESGWLVADPTSDWGRISAKSINRLVDRPILSLAPKPRDRRKDEVIKFFWGTPRS